MQNPHKLNNLNYSRNLKHHFGTYFLGCTDRNFWISYIVIFFLAY
jgi:hypothetical protein